MLLLDSSAWARLGRGGLTTDRRADVADWMHEGELGTCFPFLLEAGYSARDAKSHARLLADLRLLPHVAVDDAVEQHALDAQAALARSGHHRLPPADVLIAACAHCAGAGVLHYDRDFDVLAEHTALRFDSVWLAPAGSLD